MLEAEALGVGPVCSKGPVPARSHDIAYVRGAVTENDQRPDLLFPRENAYSAAPNIGYACPTMLAAKSSCKDR